MKEVEPSFTVILAAAGSGRRFAGGTSDKLLLDLAGLTVIQRSLALFASVSDINRVLICRHPDRSARSRDLAASEIGVVSANIEVVHLAGGKNRATTVFLALQKLAEIDPACEFVAVHDAARPLTPRALIDRVFAAAREFGAAIPGIAVTDTIKQFDPATRQITATPSRATLTAVQTPQAMRRDWLVDAYARVSPDELETMTDESSLLERAGYPVQLVEGSPENLKITVPADVDRATAIIAARDSVRD